MGGGTFRQVASMALTRDPLIYAALNSRTLGNSSRAARAANRATKTMTKNIGVSRGEAGSERIGFSA